MAVSSLSAAMATAVVTAPLAACMRSEIVGTLPDVHEMPNSREHQYQDA